MSAQENSNPLAALHVFTAHLEARARSGQQRIWLTDEARTVLKEIIRLKPGRMTFRNPPPSVPAPVPATPKIQFSSEPPPAPTPLPASSPSPLPAVPPSLSRSEKLAAIARRAESSPAARALGTLRDKMVFATGNPDAQIMFVGEAPGSDEEKQGEPFVGTAGQLLTRVIKAMGLERGDVYITNICKFRPITDDDRPQGTRNRQPTGVEMQTCIEYVLEEIAVIRPKVIVALGKTAAEGLLKRDVAITRLRGQWLEHQGIPLMPTFHPSYLKRKEDDGEAVANAEKRKHWEDMMMVMERLGMVVTEKQRRFFLPKSS